MSILNTEHLSHGFGDRVIFQNVSSHLLKGEHTGLIGANGEGKPTFMNIITDKLVLDKGKVEQAKNVWVGYLDQHTALEKDMSIQDVLGSAFIYLFDMEERMSYICDYIRETSEEEMDQTMEELGTIQGLLMAYDFYITGSEVEEVGRVLGLGEIGLDKDMTDLSGGQRAKVLLGKLLLEKPDVLPLGGPTSYLDVQHVEWLKRYLREYKNVFILISRDIPFLSSMANLVYHMEDQWLGRHVGDYGEFQGVYAVKGAQLGAAYKRQQQEIAELENFVARNKARVPTRDTAVSRQKKPDKMDVIELAEEKPGPEFHFMEVCAAGRHIFETHDLVIGYDESLSRPLNLAVERGEKIMLRGTNDIGKTTPLKSILGLTLALEGSVEPGNYLYIGYSEQEMAPGDTTTRIEEIWKEFPSYTQYRVHSVLAKCGPTTKRIESQVCVLSGGEQAKMGLCKLINRETNVLPLDEPTNYLDVEAKEELRCTLQIYRDGILLICYEPEFYKRLAMKVWDCSEWSLKI